MRGAKTVNRMEHAFIGKGGRERTPPTDEDTERRTP